MALEMLRKAGLSDGEIRVYAALLSLGRSPAGRIHEHVRMERRNLYDILNKLIERGLATYVTENRKRLFQVTHPVKIISYLDEKQEDIERLKTEVQEQLPSLVEQFSRTRTAINAELYRGAEGMKAAWDDMLNYGDIFWIGAGRYMPKQYPHYFAAWTRKRVKKKIRVFNILRHELKTEVKKPFELEHVRFLPKEFSGNPTVIGIYGNKVGNFLFGRELFVFVIESKELAENYVLYHKYLWENVCSKL